MNFGNRITTEFPELVSGAELNAAQGYFAVIVPEATQNMVLNPSVENATLTGYTAVGGAQASTSVWQAYGAYGLQLTPAVSTESGFFYGTVSLVSGTTYTASVVIQGEENKIYYIWFATTAGALIGSKRRYIGTGRKQRIWVTYTETATTTRRVYVTRDAKYTDQNVFYADGLQVEAKGYPTTYTDGDQLGFVINQVDYYWIGTPHASQSVRTSQARAGGREVCLLDYGFHLLAVQGLGMAPMVDQFLSLPGFGEVSQGTGTTAREFSLIGALYSDAEGPRRLQSLRTTLMDALKPDVTVISQPLILRYQATDEDGYPLSDSLDIICKFLGGMEGDWNNDTSNRLALNFKMHDPKILATYGNGGALGYQTTVANADLVFQRSSGGVWSALDGGLGVVVGSQVYTFAIGNDGLLIIGGNFTTGGNRIVSWNGTAFGTFGGGMNNNVLALDVGPDGSIYAGGQFTLADGVANTDGIAKWNGAAWVALGTGISAGTNAVYAVAVGLDGSVYAGGAFTQMGGVANTLKIAKWNGSAWVAMTTGITIGSGVNAIAVGKDGYVYVAGNFTEAGGVAGTAYIARWNGTAWTPMGTGADGVIFALAIGPDGSVYAGGNFLNIGGIAANKIAKWNGTSWSALGSGLTGGGATCYALTIGPDGNLYASGSFTTAGGLVMPDPLAMWTGSNWIPVDVNLTASTYTSALIFDRPGTFYVGGVFKGNATASIPASVTSLYSAHPTFIFTGPGTIYQIKNYTTGQSIYFNLTLLAGEKATLVLDPTHFSFTSTFRGNIANTILPGSTIDFDLLPGVNNISAYIFGSTTAATGLVMQWNNRYWAIDQAAI